MLHSVFALLADIMMLLLSQMLQKQTETVCFVHYLLDIYFKGSCLKKIMERIFVKANFSIWQYFGLGTEV